MPPTKEPVAEVVKMSVLGHSAKEISDRLSDLGYTVPPRRVKAIQTRVGPEVIQWVREEYMDEAAVAIFDYRRKLQKMMTVLENRFLEADQAYEDWKQVKGQTFSGLLEEYRQDPNPDITNYIARANAMTEGLNLTKLSKILKDLHGEQAKLLELGAKIDAKLQTTHVTNNTTINIETLVEEVYESLCEDCQVRLTEQ